MPAAEETIASEVLAASLGGAISASILYPLEVLKTKMQASVSDEDEDKDADSMIPFARRLLEEQGLEVFFRGMETSAFQSALEKACYFFAYTGLKAVYALMAGKEAKLDALTNLLLGCASEWAHLPITLPVDAWTTRIQTSEDGPLKVLLTMLGDKDFRPYKGLEAYFLLCFKPALQYTVYEQVKAAWLRNKPYKTLSAAQAFVLGMIARTVATIAVFPFLRAKVLMQTQKSSSCSEEDAEEFSDDSNKKKTRMLELLWQLWQRDGLSGLYHGLGPELTRGVLSAALMLMIKERIAEKVRQWLASSGQQHKRLPR